MIRTIYYCAFFLIITLLSGCHGEFTPKPKAYPRITFPDRKYEAFNPESCPFKFNKPVYASVSRDSSPMGASQPCWLNITFPDFNGTVNLTYKEINKDLTLARLLDDAHKLSFKHTKKANYIDESLIVNKHGVSGIFYNVGGDAASNVQFFLTDSSRHFIRGSLYFFNEPNSDSMGPILTFVKQDLDTILSSFEWK